MGVDWGLKSGVPDGALPRAYGSDVTCTYWVSGYLGYGKNSIGRDSGGEAIVIQWLRQGILIGFHEQYRETPCLCGTDFGDRRFSERWRCSYRPGASIVNAPS